MFDAQGHIQISAVDFLQAAKANVQQAVEELTLSGTPHAFATFSEYRKFLDAVGKGLGVHPRTIVVRGSAHFGFSTSPQAHKVWRPFRVKGSRAERPSDIDVAIVDVEYFHRMDNEVQDWESRQRRPKMNEPGANHWLRREQLRRHNIWADDDALPPSTCIPHVNAIANLNTTAFCGGVRRKVSAYVYRNWWSLQDKCMFDLGHLIKLASSQALPKP